MKPGEHHVRERAYYIWEGEGRVFGRADEHWLRAEAEFIAMGAVAPTDPVALPLTVQSSAPAMSDAPSPAKALKPRSSRAGSRAVSAKAEEATRAVEKATAKVVPAKASASKSAGAKSSGAKASTTKSSSSKSKSAPRNSSSPSVALH